MIDILRELVVRMNAFNLKDTDLIPWSSPIPSFGDLKSAEIATIGINPSNLEFADKNGHELTGVLRRFHTLQSLDLENWLAISDEQLQEILDLCARYFERNPYDAWFKKLDYIISGIGYSYYFPVWNACHLDLTPYATSGKWSFLKRKQQSELLDLSNDILGELLAISNIHTIILNGQSVVDNFLKISSIQFKIDQKPEWTLYRQKGNSILGRSYIGKVSEIGGVNLGRDIRVLGFNHNLQSSYGITKEVHKSIRNWITKELNK